MPEKDLSLAVELIHDTTTDNIQPDTVFLARGLGEDTRHSKSKGQSPTEVQFIDVTV